MKSRNYFLEPIINIKLNRKKFIEWLGDRKKLDYNTYKKAVKRIFDQPVSSVTHKLRTRYPEILKGVEFTNMPPGGGKFYEATRLTLKEAANIQKNLPALFHYTRTRWWQTKMENQQEYITII